MEHKVTYATMTDYAAVQTHRALVDAKIEDTRNAIGYLMPDATKDVDARLDVIERLLREVIDYALEAPDPYGDFKPRDHFYQPELCRYAVEPLVLDDAEQTIERLRNEWYEAAGAW